MKQYVMTQAERITKSVEGNIVDLIGKLCEGEPPEVKSAVWTMLTTRMAFRSGHGDCFILPPLEDL